MSRYLICFYYLMTNAKKNASWAELGRALPGFMVQDRHGHIGMYKTAAHEDD